MDRYRSLVESSPAGILVVLINMIGGLIIGFIARKLHSLPLGIVTGALVTGAITYPIAAAPNENGQTYFWEILIPGMIVGLIVGYATQRHESKRSTS